jgi:tetratricopeptide repeat protein
MVKLTGTRSGLAAWLLWATAGQAAMTPQELVESTHTAVASGERTPGAWEQDGLVVAVGVASVATFGNSQRAGLRAEDKAELAAFGELRLWALSHQSKSLEELTGQLGHDVPPEALSAYLGTVSGDVEIRDVLARDRFHDQERAFAILVVAPGTIGPPALDRKDFERNLEEFLKSDPSVGEAAYEVFATNRSQAEALLYRQLEAEGLPVEPFRDPWSALDRELDGLAGKAPAASRSKALEQAKAGQERLEAGDLAAARTSFLQALAAEPLLSAADVGLAKVYLKRKLPNLALHFLELGICGEGNRRELYETQSEALKQAGRTAESRLAATFAAQTPPGSPIVTWLLPAYSQLVDAKQMRAALLVRCDGQLPLNELRTRWPRREAEAQQLFEKGKAAFGKSTDTSGALNLFFQAVEADPFHVEALSYAAASLRAQGNPAGARLFAGLAVRLDPKHATARVNLALGLEGLGAPELARAELERAKALGPQDVWTQRKIAEGLTRLSGATSGGKTP